MTLPAIELNEFLPHTVEHVWRAIVTPELLAQWLMENDFQPVAGRRFHMRGVPVPAVGFSGQVISEVLEVAPPRRLVISWADALEGNALQSVVTFELGAEGAGTRLKLRHDGFDEGDPAQSVAHRILSVGWRAQVLPRLKALLAKALEAPTED